MWEAKPKDDKADFEDLITACNNDELLSVLKKRKYYNRQAADFAVSEAISRGLIHSEQDLFDIKFKEENMQFSWFPVPNNQEARKKTKNSIIRNLIITGLIPAAYGLFQLYKGESEFAESALVFGLLWVLLTYLLNRQKLEPILVALFAANLLGGAFLIQHLIRTSGPVIEFFMVIVLMFLVTYGLIFFYMISKADQKDQ